MDSKKILGLLPLYLALFMQSPLFSAPLHSSRWGFLIDLPEGYRYTGGDGESRFAFQSLSGAHFDLRVYPANEYPSIKALAEDIPRRLKNQGTVELFEYRTKQAALITLRFQNSGDISEGWGLCIELDPSEIGRGKPLLLALAYGQAGREDLRAFHLSALDSIAPTIRDRRAPGPVIDQKYPRGRLTSVPIAGLEARALVYEHDAKAAQALVDREFGVLSHYASSPLWKEAWTRFYRTIYRDSFDRLTHVAFALERHWNIPSIPNRDLAGKALSWVQSFAYERDLMGSDFVNLVSAAIEGRGDCDSRSLLWAIILSQANIPTAIMVSHHYSHAMGLADVPGTGAHFTFAGTSWLVAETTSRVAVGLISADMSEKAHWIGIAFE
ncbi:MAG: hypothetical protein LBD24_03865 [Spirochaetaceae bacterium]|jgi:hypothetical protein|nr:hypothetical protein [Spirochaetaceae bacterium]